MRRIAMCIAIIILLIMYSCQKDDEQETYLEGTNEYTNQWIYEQMKRYYYWNESLPGKGDLSAPPNEYFDRLLYQDDRFSYAVKPNDAGTYPKSLRNSFGFDMAFVEHEGTTYGVVLYVLTGSPAYAAGMERGNLIVSINSTAITAGNYEGLYKSASQAASAQLEVVTYTGQSGFSAPQEVSLNYGLILLQPVRSRVIQDQNHIVGYIEIPHFDIGLSQTLLNAFAAFKSQGVLEVVVDLRYNGGGDVSSATALCALLAPNIQADDLFIRFKGNDNGGAIDQTFRQALEMNEQQVSFEALRNAHPAIQRVFILCGSHSASASEIVINNLKPFMEVVTIGEKTVGKDTATFPVEDEREGPQEGKWVLYPAIYKLFNANGQGNYTSGIPPVVSLNELSELEVRALGDIDEVLLSYILDTVAANGRLAHTSMVKPLPLKPGLTAKPDPVIIY